MNSQFDVRRVVLLISAVLVVGAPVLYFSGLLPFRSARLPQNSLLVLAPYRHAGTWVFDDPRVGLVREPFVAGVPEMIDILVADIPEADQGFRMTVSATEFPGYEKELTWNRAEADGNWYTLAEPPMEGWLCPALFKYFDHAPEHLYVKAEPLE
ncbi:DUF6717 family protein [Aeoliella sp. SH292]|uniref:DUF6717 family protein n=1 Tax=Aeoliella sp. SH292 TaxID=3454464 RepID=UPI003F9BEA24